MSDDVNFLVCLAGAAHCVTPIWYVMITEEPLATGTARRSANY